MPETAREQAEKALAALESLHPTGRIAVGSATHGGPIQYADGCERHGAWCRDWSVSRKAIAKIRSALLSVPETENREYVLIRVACELPREHREEG